MDQNLNLKAVSSLSELKKHLSTLYEAHWNNYEGVFWKMFAKKYPQVILLISGDFYGIHVVVKGS